MGLFHSLGSLLGSGQAGARTDDPNARKLNEPCWCGSGKKYKKCHLYQDYKEITRKIPLNEHG